VLVLLIILMVTVPVIESGIEVNVPQTRVVQSNTEERTTVTINRKGLLYIGSEAVNIHDLGPKIRKVMHDPAGEVYLRADKDVSWEAVAHVIDELRVNHIDKIDVVTKPYEKGQE
jgi:biopolymer transport protein TolR